MTFHHRCAACLACALAQLSVGCGPLGSGGDDDPGTLPPASDFKCSDLDGTQTACVDFSNDGDAAKFDDEGGDWKIVDGRYVGFGPDDTAPPCADSLITHAIFPSVHTQDFSLHAQLAAVKRVDKILVLRSSDEANRIQLNFRSLDTDGTYGDLMVQEVKNCVFTIFTHAGDIPMRDSVGEPIDVDVDMQGPHLVVSVGGQTVVDQDEPFAVRSGQIGFGVIDHSEAVFDNMVLHARD